MAIYEWAGESPTSSVNASYCSSECSDYEDNDSPTTSKKVKQEDSEDTDSRSRLLRDHVAMALGNDLTVSLTNPDALASLIGHFDMDTLRASPSVTIKSEQDESTLKAPQTFGTSYADRVRGPTDFSQLDGNAH